MTLTLELSPDVEARLQAEAAARGLPLPEYALRRLIGEETPPEELPHTGAEAIAYWRRHGALGLFADRGDVQEFCEELRRKASTRQW